MSALRERILALIAEGVTPGDLATALGTSTETVLRIGCGAYVRPGSEALAQQNAHKLGEVKAKAPPLPMVPPLNLVSLSDLAVELGVDRRLLLRQLKAMGGKALHQEYVGEGGRVGNRGGKIWVARDDLPSGKKWIGLRGPVLAAG